MAIAVSYNMHGKHRCFKIMISFCSFSDLKTYKVNGGLSVFHEFQSYQIWKCFEFSLKFQIIIWPKWFRVSSPLVGARNPPILEASACYQPTAKSDNMISHKSDFIMPGMSHSKTLVWGQNSMVWAQFYCLTQNQGVASQHPWCDGITSVWWHHVGDTWQCHPTPGELTPILSAQQYHLIS